MNFDPQATQRLRKRALVSWPILAVLLVALVGYGSCTVYVAPYEMGVKQVLFGSNQGVQKEVYKPGVHWLVRFTETMHTFPTDLQALEMTDSTQEVVAAADQRVVRAIKIQTSEGYTVSVEVTVLYRIDDPYQVITQIGPGRLYEDSAVIPRAEQVLRRTFGELDAEEFYSGTKREKASADAQKLLDAELKPKGIQVTHVLVQQYRYDQRYQEAIEQRKIQDQSVFKNQAEAAAAQAEALKNRVVAEGSAKVQTELARGDAEVQKLTSTADLYRRTKAAEGQLMVKLARAQGIDLENKALRGAGSDNLVGLKMADVLKGTQVVVLPSDGEGGTNPLDLATALKRFDVRAP